MLRTVFIGILGFSTIILGGCAGVSHPVQSHADIEKECHAKGWTHQQCMAWQVKKKQATAAESAAVNRPTPNFYLPPLR